MKSYVILLKISTLALLFSSCASMKPNLNNADSLRASIIRASEQKSGSVLIPVFMYYVERYLLNIPDKTETDSVIASILNESKESQEFFKRAFENYKAIPEKIKFQIFDKETLKLTSDVAKELNIDSIREILYGLDPRIVEGCNKPIAPSSLAARNASTFEPKKYQIELKWQDNSSDEDGFFIYRFNYYSVVGVKPQLVSSVGPNVTSFVDILKKPLHENDQYCYQVTAFKRCMITEIGQPFDASESDPSNIACSYYEIAYPPLPQPIDTDKDGIPDYMDECPTDHSEGAEYYTKGCPDDDDDGWPNKDDNCKQVWGDDVTEFKNAYFPPKGCPIKYNLRWMGMKILNNSEICSDDGKILYNEDEYVPDFAYGEEPYLLFSFVNGMTANGMKEAGTTRWCCGGHVNVKAGKDFEPNQDVDFEEYPQQLKDLRDNGLTIFPSIPNKFAEVDRDLGLIITVTLMERDKDKVIPAMQESELTSIFKVGGTIGGAISTCVGTGGIGCLTSIGMAMKTIIETIFDLMKPAPPATATDPDDFMGTDVWAITRYEAKYRTDTNGAYAFCFDMPTTFYQGWPAGFGPTKIKYAFPATMRVRLYFCLYRENTPASEIKKACSAYNKVDPIIN